MSSILDPIELPILYRGTNVDDSGQDFVPATDVAGDIVGIAHVGGMRKMNIHTFSVTVTETCGGAGVIKLWNGAIGGTLLATINLLTTAAGKTIHKQIVGSTGDVEAGSVLTIELDAVATTTGHGLFSITGRMKEEAPANVTNMVATT